MGDFIFNIAKGRHVELYRRVKGNDPAASVFRVFILKTAEADGALKDHDTMAAVFGAPGNDEADFTNYANQVIADTDLAAIPAPDDTNDRADQTLPNQTIANAGGAANNTTAKVVVGYDPDGTDTDANTIPVAAYDFVKTTTGADLPINFAAAGSWRAAE